MNDVPPRRAVGTLFRVRVQFYVMTDPSGHGTRIPPEIYDLGFGWDPQPEIELLQLLSREAYGQPEAVLELGCGTARLLRAFPPKSTIRVGIDLDRDMIDYARQFDGLELHEADMSDFCLQRRFDLIFCSANTLRWLSADAPLRRMWQCIREHLAPHGIFVADLELGRAHLNSQVGHPSRWEISRDGRVVESRWEVLSVPSDEDCCTTEWAFTLHSPGAPMVTGRSWSEQFPLRIYEPAELVHHAAEAGFACCGLYENRLPYLLPRPPEIAHGRIVAVFQNAN